MKCMTNPLTIGMSWLDSKKIDLDPPYQRETGVWSLEKRQLFIDSIINKFDTPKIYFHDLTDQKKPIAHAVIDGKQRLSAVWSFLENNFPLSDSFTYFGTEEDPPHPGDYLKDFSDEWRERVKAQSFDVVYVRDAEEQDIEELFSRLNNGEALNAAEKRNAMGGDMSRLIRELSKDKFFKTKLGFKDKRYSHFEVSAKLIRIEESRLESGGTFCDLKKRHLDNMVRIKRTLPAPKKKKLDDALDKGLKLMCDVFNNDDPSLGKQSYPQMYYLFLDHIVRTYGAKDLRKRLKEFIPWFQSERVANNAIEDEDKRDINFVEYGRLAMQGTNDVSSMELRNEILTRKFLIQNPDVRILDSKRLFSVDERHAIWYHADKTCASCGDKLAFEDFDADHRDLWAHGGETTLANARCLCTNCNRSNISAD